jgi:hypothetical protein
MYARALGPERSAQAAAHESSKADPMSEAEAERQAATEGLTLMRSGLGNTGYLGVSRHACVNKPYMVRIKEGGKQRCLGYFSSPHEAALVYARARYELLIKESGKALWLGLFSSDDHEAARASALAFEVDKRARAAGDQASKADPMSEAEAEQQAATEGLTLPCSGSNKTGYSGVKHYGYHGGTSRSYSYQAMITEGGKGRSLGTFSSPHEAALAYARALGPERSARPRAAAEIAPMSLAVAEQQAVAEGLTLRRSGNSTGYMGVQYKGKPKSKPYRARIKQGGNYRTLGSYSSPHEAALAHARACTVRQAARAFGPERGAQAAAVESALMSAAEAEEQAAAAGLTRMRSSSSSTGSTGYEGVKNKKKRKIRADIMEGAKKLGIFSSS